MSFMFNPFPYNDPNAVNNLTNDGSVQTDRIARGTAQLAAVFADLCQRNRVIAIDGYTTAPFDALIGLLPAGCELISVAGIYKSAAELKALLADYLPEDREKDPVLLYGRLFKAGYPGLFDEKKLAALQKRLAEKRRAVRGTLRPCRRSYFRGRYTEAGGAEHQKRLLPQLRLGRNAPVQGDHAALLLRRF